MAKYTDAQLGEAIREAKGMVYVAAKALGCSPNTIKARLGKSEELQQILEDEAEHVLDRAETKLFAKIEEGDITAIKYLLSTKGRIRGYFGDNGVSFEILERLEGLERRAKEHGHKA